MHPRVPANNLTEFVPSSPVAFRAFVEREIAMWAEAVKVSGAQAD
ncbi:hypothetical protein WKR98_08800 [Pigmentiphaga sp. YJ18]|nr:hypothetical protein [Pigmentiphaga sp. H8]